MIKLTAKEIAELLELKESYVRFILHKKKIGITRKYLGQIIELIVERRIKMRLQGFNMPTEFDDEKPRRIKRYSKNPVLYYKALAKAGWKCELCGSDIRLNIHHKDKIHENHTLNNLQVLCWNCHKRQHWEGKRK